MSLQRNRFLAIGGGLAGFILFAGVVLLVLANLQLGRAKRDLEGAYRRLERLHGRDPYPSEQNRKALQENRERLEFEVGELAAALMRDPFPADAAEAADFSARAQGVIERFRKRAETAGVALPDNLEVGFAEYASGGAVPAARHVPRLSRQLYSMERVADILVRGGVDSIGSLSRDTFENAPAAQPPARRRPARGAPPPSGRQQPGRRASEVHPDGLYYIERIGVEFEAAEDVVWRILDLFAAAPHFMVVSEFAHKTQTDILSYNPETVKRGGEGDDATLRYLSEGILVGKKALSRPERLIAGNESVVVRLVVDVYNFEPAEEGR